MAPLHKLIVLHTNDIHSHFEQMPKIASFIESQRQAAGEDHLLVLDIGDHMDRMWPETEGSGGAANVAVMNETGYDAVTLGNNEGLTFTSEMLESVYSDAHFAIIGSNLPRKESGKLPSWLLPYYVVRKAGLRIGLIGVTAYFTEYYRLLGWDIQEPLAVVKELAGQLRPVVDVLIVMSHLGLKNDERMANQIEGIDLILGGHTHHLLEEPLRIGGSYLGAAGKHGQYVGVMEISYDPQQRHIMNVSGYCQDVSALSDAPKLLSIRETYAQEAKVKLGQVVCELAEPLDVDWSGESRLGNLLAGGIRSWVGAEIGIINSGVLLEGLSSGKVDQNRLLDICPSPINPCRMLLSGAHILQALEESLIPEFQERRMYGFGFRGKVLGNLCLDGASVEYDPEGPSYHKIKEVRVGGELLQPGKSYVVGTFDMFTFGAGYAPLSQGTDVSFFLPQFIRDVLERQLLNTGAIRDSAVKRWHAV
ncbi:bifunctional metallophosphatase/5'-nucleotidase [Paenibacillus thalictri]|uniref:Bifunctional metallophosphatase/5'-nucleotidase n=1 Tax=Paenibacillus thalictri TaxID=2527873 RepID=A0A4Q9DMX3_9BACL|nr:bifunctional UDP-sugar hydrolase/5'-nucleotidase [Paenibacillus thalictri]TBL75090.1 bifunctional metallophosphatase/5'-nucleotidase [Paenibacillus thalictri]